MYPLLKENIVFTAYNLATEASSHELHACLYCDVLVDFNPSLQKRVHQRLHNRLTYLGILGLGAQEILARSPDRQCYKPMQAQAPFDRRTA